MKRNILKFWQSALQKHSKYWPGLINIQMFERNSIAVHKLNSVKETMKGEQS